MTFAYTSQQLATFDAIDNTSDNLLVIARAGTGKTFTLVKAMLRMRGSIIALSFNTDITKEISAKIAAEGITNANGKTFHAIGLAAIRTVFPNVKIDDQKGKRIMEELHVPKLLRGVVSDLASKAKQRGFVQHAHTFRAGEGVIDLKNRDEWMKLVAHYDIEMAIVDLLDAETNVRSVAMLVEAGIEGTQATLRYAINLAVKAIILSIKYADSVIDFDDMIYLPVALKMRMRSYDWVLVDEAQDTNPLRRMIVRKIMKPRSRVVLVGDDRQAIYAFTGADNDALEIIQKEFNCRTLALTVTHRCPKAVVDLAKTIVADYEAAASAPMGSVRDIELKEFAKADFQPGRDAVICRNTKPLVEIAYGLIRRGIPVHVRGKEIGKGIISLISRWKSPRTVSELLDRLEAYREDQMAKYRLMGKEEAGEALSDRIETIQVIADTLCLDDPIEALVEKVKGLFREDKEADRTTVPLMTAHGSKGLEFPRVWLIGENRFMPSRFARLPHQIVQEKNLVYVSYTRAQEELVRVSVPQDDDAFAQTFRIAA